MEIWRRCPSLRRVENITLGWYSPLLLCYTIAFYNTPLNFKLRKKSDKVYDITDVWLYISIHFYTYINMAVYNYYSI